LDHVINALKNVNIISASTGIGKTAFALDLDLNLEIDQGIPILYYNHEINIYEVIVRLRGVLSGMPLIMVIKRNIKQLTHLPK